MFLRDLMFGGDYTGFLLHTAEEVNKLIAEPWIMQRFREHLRKFCQLDGTRRYFLLSLPYELHVEEAADPLYDDLDEASSENDKLRTDYAKLTIIHDKRLKGPATRKINDGIWPEDENQDCRPEDVWNHINEMIHIQEAQADIRCALERVKADIAKEKEAHSKTGRESWFWKLYEKSLKAFFDAVLDWLRHL